MKIGFLMSQWPSRDVDSGVAQAYHRVAVALAARNHHVTVFHLYPGRAFWERSRRYREQGFDVVEIPCRLLPPSLMRGWVPFHLAALLRLFLKRNELEQLDVIETIFYGGFARLYQKLIWRGRPPILVRVSTTGEQTSEINQQTGTGYSAGLEKQLIRTAPYLCTHTAAHRNLLCANLGIDPARIEMIPHGIAMPDLSTLPPVKEKKVLYVGRYEPRKGTDVLLQAIPLVLSREPDVRFVLVGSGLMAHAWKTEFLAKHAACADRVEFLEQLSDAELETLYQGCDFFVAPARYESFGLTYIEAMRYGKPVIGCLASGGSVEVIGDGGLLVPAGEAQPLAEAIVRLWTDRDLHRELSLRARRQAERYSIERQVEISEEVYARMIRGGSS